MEGVIIWGDIGVDGFILWYGTGIGLLYTAIRFVTGDGTLLYRAVGIAALLAMIIRCTPAVYDTLVGGLGWEVGVVLVALSDTEHSGTAIYTLSLVPGAVSVLTLLIWKSWRL